MPKISRIKDNIVTLSGKYKYTMDQYWKLSKNTKGFVLSASETGAKLLVVGDPGEIKVNDSVTLSKDNHEVSVYKHQFGKVISPFGEVLHPVSKVKTTGKTPFAKGSLETPSVPILDREPLDEPLNTGMLAIDTMIPVGKGQRELIIGDRNTGKTTIAVNTIINQKGTDVKTIYVAIGQKRSSIISTYNTLVKNDAMDNAIIIFSNPDSAAQQFLAAKIGMAMAQAIAFKGEDVLIVFDDLTKHSNVYREVSLSIGRSPGREAHPTDIFFQHASLLEKAGKFNKKYKNGTITALPIVETIQGDLASLIPSNVISITDGQIFTSANMFNNGKFPAIDIKLSVSRTGSAVQSKIIRNASKSLKADYTKLFEIQKFSDMSIDVSKELEMKIEKWNGLNSALLQFGNEGHSKATMVIILELYRYGALGKLEKPKIFSNIIRNFIKTDKVAKKVAKKIESGKITKKELDDAVKGIFIPLAKTASGESGNLFSRKEIEELERSI